MNRYTITTRDGNVIDNLTMNGTMFVSQDEITEDMLTVEKLASVTITETDDEENTKETVLENAVCDSIIHWTEGWLFNVREMTENEKLRKDNEMLTECILEMSEIIYA